MTARATIAFLLGALAVSALAAREAVALPARSVERVEIFATCSGRLSALATRQMALDDARASESERLRDEFNLLLGAILPDALTQGISERQARDWHAQGWTEIALLLADADHSLDVRRARRARLIVTDRIATCRKMLL